MLASHTFPPPVHLSEPPFLSAHEVYFASGPAFLSRAFGRVVVLVPAFQPSLMLTVGVRGDSSLQGTAFFPSFFHEALDFPLLPLPSLRYLPPFGPSEYDVTLSPRPLLCFSPMI